MLEDSVDSVAKYLTSYWESNFSKRADMKVCVDYYPYGTTLVKIFRKKDHLLIRFSEAIKQAPNEILKAGGRLMLHRIARHRPIPTDKVIFHQFASEIDPLSLPRSNTKKRMFHPPSGKFHDLNFHFTRIKDAFFEDVFSVKEMGWSKKPVKSYFAHYRRDYDRITVNRALDDPVVPTYIIEYLLFHESLHVTFPPRYVSNRLVKHTPELKRCERKFPMFKESKQWLKSEGNRLIRRKSR